MTITVKLALANTEVNQLFTRKLANNTRFYDAMMQKISVLSRHAQEQQVYALQALHRIQSSIQTLTHQFDDEIDQFEGLLEKKKQARGKSFSFQARFHPSVSFENRIAADLVMLFEMYDRLLSTLNILRAVGCFANDDDYFHNLRRYFKQVNRLLSHVMLTPVKTLPSTLFSDVIDNTDNYLQAASIHGDIDCAWLYRAMTSNLAPRLHEAIRQPLLSRLKNRQELHQATTKPSHEDIQ